MSERCLTCNGHGWVPAMGQSAEYGTEPCPDCASPQPDTGPWTPDEVTRVVDAVLAEEDDPALARRVAAALNRATATPAERAVIDAAVTWVDAPQGVAKLDAYYVMDAAVARLRSERNKTDPAPAEPVCTTCVNGMVPVSGRGGDGYDPCPDCWPVGDLPGDTGNRLDLDGGPARPLTDLPDDDR